MPDSMNYMNDPNAMPQQGSMQGWDPAYADQMQGWDPAYAAQMQDPAYMQAMYGQDPMAAQAMYGNQMSQQGYPSYSDPMAQGIYGDPAAYQQGGFYQDPSYMQPGYETSEQQMPMDYGMQQQQMQQSQQSPQTQSQPTQVGQSAQVGIPGALPQQQPQTAQAAQPTQPMGAVAMAPEQQTIQTGVQAQQIQPGMQQPGMTMQPSTNMKPPSKGKATASLIMGIFSIILAILPPVGIFLGWFSSRMAKKYIKAGGTSAAADSGKIFGKVGYLFSWIMLFVLGILIAYMAGASETGNTGARNLIILYNNSPLGKFILGTINLPR